MPHKYTWGLHGSVTLFTDHYDGRIERLWLHEDGETIVRDKWRKRYAEMTQEIFVPGEEHYDYFHTLLLGG